MPLTDPDVFEPGRLTPELYALAIETVSVTERVDMERDWSNGMRGALKPPREEMSVRGGGRSPAVVGVVAELEGDREDRVAGG